MLINFFECLKQHEIPVSITELLDLIEGLDKGVVYASQEDFYYYARLCLIKDEKHFDRYDRAFSAFFNGLDSMEGLLEAFIPEDWLRAEIEKHLTDEEKAKIKSFDNLKDLIEAFKERLEEQQKKHSGGNKWIGTKGTSPFGNSGYHPGGIRIGGESRNKQAAKVWDRREYKNLDEDEQISARNMHVALRRLRKFARTGAEDQLNIDETIRSTANNAGLLDIKMEAERHNAVKVLMLFDVGGSMDYHVKEVQTLFNAVRTEFKHLEYYYFHNFIYESVWKNNQRRFDERTSLYELINTYSADYKLILVGDAAMGPYEILAPGGSVEHWNDEAGAVWIRRLLDIYPNACWLNPEPQNYWNYAQSNQIVRELMDDRMFPLTVHGLEDAMSSLTR